MTYEYFYGNDECDYGYCDEPGLGQARRFSSRRIPKMGVATGSLKIRLRNVAPTWRISMSPFDAVTVHGPGVHREYTAPELRGSISLPPGTYNLRASTTQYGRRLSGRSVSATVKPNTVTSTTVWLPRVIAPAPAR